jgi:hypothetical protein
MIRLSCVAAVMTDDSPLVYTVTVDGCLVAGWLVLHGLHACKTCIYRAGVM